MFKEKDGHVVSVFVRLNAIHYQIMVHKRCSSLKSKIKGTVLPYSLSSVGPGADPGVQAVSPQVTLSHPPGGRLPLFSAKPAVTFPAKVRHCPNYTAWWQRYMGVNNLPKIDTLQHSGWGLNSRPLSHQSDALAARLSSHRGVKCSMNNTRA